MLNGVAVVGADVALDRTALVEAIKSSSATTNVDAYIDAEGRINLFNSPGHEGAEIVISSTDVDNINTLGLASARYAGQLVLTSETDLLQFDIVTSADQGGKPADLAALGL